MQINRIVVLALALALPPVSTVASGDVPDRSAAIALPSDAVSRPFYALAWSEDADDGISLLGLGQLIHVPEGSTTPQAWALQDRSFYTSNPPRYLVATDDDGLIGTFEHECRVESLSQNGQWRWQSTPFSSGHCRLSRPLVQADSVIVAARTSGEHILVFGLDRHGLSRWQSELMTPHLHRLAAPLLADDGNQVYVVAAQHRNNQDEGLDILALDYEGNLRWRWSSSAAESLQLSNLTTLPDGGVEVAAFDDADRLVLLQLSAGGAMLQRRTVTVDGIRGMSALPRPDGGGYILGSASPGHPTTLAGYLDSGTTVWTQQIGVHCTGMIGNPEQCARLTGDGDVIIFGNGEPNRLERYGRDGTSRYVRSFDDPDRLQRPMFALSVADDQLVVGVRTWLTQGNFIIQRDHLEWLDSAGELIEQVQLPGETNATGRVLGPYVIEEDGAVTVVIAPSNTAPFRRARVAPNGGLDFDVSLPQDIIRVDAAGRCGEQDICIAARGDYLSVYRFAGNDPLPTWRADPDLPTALTQTEILPLVGGDIDLLVTIHRSGIPGTPPSPTSQRFMRITADGTVGEQRILQVTSPDTGMLLARADTGEFAMLSQSGVLRHVDTTGVESIRAENVPRAYRNPWHGIPGAFIGHPGTFAYVGLDLMDANPQAWPLLLVRVDADGSTQTTSLGDWPFQFDNEGLPPTFESSLAPPVVIGIVAIGFNDTLVGIEQSIDATRGFRTELVRVDANGAIQWRRSWTNQEELGFQLDVDDSDRIMLSSRRSDGGWVARALDSDGALLDQRQPRCADGPCRIDHAALGIEGTMIGIGRSDGEDLPVGYRVWQLRGMFAPNAVSLGATGLEGTWYDPSSAGQGFTLRRYANDGGSTVFMPWFTFSIQGGNSPELLRWYTIQGQIEAGQESASLPLLANTGGRFDAPPITEPLPVGEVQLRFADCARGVLDYRFDAEHGGAEGSIALKRLLPPGMPCGNVEMAMHDPLLSASWYDPTTSGQGLDLYRIIGTTGADDVLFGSWYTYSPGAPVGAESDQHWFTLQGIEASPDGGWTTTIVQTLGGRLDGQPTGNHFRVGKAMLHSVDCTHLQLQYRFDDSEEVGDFRGLDGTIQLQRIGDCPANP